MCLIVTILHSMLPIVKINYAENRCTRTILQPVLVMPWQIRLKTHLEAALFFERLFPQQTNFGGETISALPKSWLLDWIWRWTMVWKTCLEWRRIAGSCWTWFQSNMRPFILAYIGKGRCGSWASGFLWPTLTSSSNSIFPCFHGTKWWR